MVICSSLHSQHYTWCITEEFLLGGSGGKMVEREKKKSNLVFTGLLKGNISLELFKLGLTYVIFLHSGLSGSA